MSTSHAIILGGTRFQENFIEPILKCGLKPIVLDQNQNCYLASLGYDFLRADIKDADLCLSSVKHLDIAGVFTGQSDIGVPTMGFINSQLGLDGVNHEAAVVASDKTKFRELMEKYNIPQPSYRVCCSIKEVQQALIAIGCPCILKPSDSSGSRGVSVISSINDLELAYHNAAQFSRNGKLLLEQYIVGVEYGAQVFAYKGKIISNLLHTDWTCKNIPVGHCMPIINSNLPLLELERVCKESVLALNYDGPANVDLIVDAHGSVFIIEIGARIGATGLPDLVQLSTDVDLYQLQVYSALQAKIPYELPIRHNYNSGVRILSSHVDIDIQDSVLTQLPSFCKDLKRHYGLTFIQLDNLEIKKVNRLQSGIDRYGLIGIQDKQQSIEDMQATLDEVNNSISIFLSRRKP